MFRYPSVTLVILILSTTIAAEEQSSRPHRHRAGVQLGVLWPTTARLELGDGGIVIDRAAFLGTLRYRYAVTPTVELGGELRHWIGRWPRDGSRSAKAAAGFVGPGVRLRPSGTGRIAPFVQCNIYWVQEQVTLSRTRTANGFGWGVSGGIDVTVTPWLAIPFEASYVGSSGGAIDDLSGFGLSGGVDFRF